MEKAPFVVGVSEETLADLRERLTKTRWPDEVANAHWEYGTNLDYLRELVAYWRDSYDWRHHEHTINAFPHYQMMIDGVPIHFIHQAGHGPKPLPLILTHGWPWTFWDLHKVIRPLSDPAAFGGDAQDAFDVVVPSLPGYGFSTPLSVPGLTYWRTADLWVKLMREGLGYDRFGAQGGDWGALVSAQLGYAHAERIIGIHLTLLPPLSLAMPDPSDYSAEERGWREQTQRFWREESGYFALQSTKPQTLAYGLNDSPVGRCAWIVEKRRTWSDCQGEIERRFTKDELLTTVRLYWVTESVGSSVRYYYEARHHPWQPSHPRTPVVEVPTGVAVFPREVILLPRRWAER